MFRRSDTGATVRLLRPLTRAGGEGQVFEIEGSKTLVAKVYHHPADSGKIAKLRHQVQAANPSLTAIAAWPVACLLDGPNPANVRGLIMARMPGKEIHRLYGPNDRSQEFPKAGWDFLIHVAMNCAAAFETLHSNGILMADVNEGNLLVSENDGRVGLIDCDSYQIQAPSGTLGCDVGIPMWTPPELQGVGYRGLVRTANHDRFGLAVLVFRLLFMGRHPFSGIPAARDQLEIEQAIRRYLFAFSPQVWSQGIRQPPHTLSLSSVPEGLRRLFDRAFLPGSEKPNSRPTGREWAQELKSFLGTLKRACLDPGHKSWDKLASCPWCAITNTGGPNFFVSVAIHLGSADWAAELNKCWATIERILQGELVRESASLPLVVRPQGRAMPISRPQSPSGSAPVAPPKPTLVAKSIPAAPTLPDKPTLRPPLKLPAIPIGHQERMSLYGGLGAIFFAGFTAFCRVFEAEIAMYGALWAFVSCLVFCAIKRRAASQERVQRQEAESQARQLERSEAEQEFAKALGAYELEVARIGQRYQVQIAQAEIEYQKEWLRRDQEYQTEYSEYLAKSREYEGEQRRYAEELAVWDAEVQRRQQSESRLQQSAKDIRNQLQTVLEQYQAKVQGISPSLDSARQRFEKARADEIAEMRRLHSRRQELQLSQYLMKQQIRDADIPGIGSGRKAALAAYNICTAMDVQPNLQVPGFGAVLIGKLQAWRKMTEANFRFNAAIPLPVSEVNAVKVKFGQAQQSALAELRMGAASLENLEANTRGEVDRLKRELLTATRDHAQAKMDLAVCA